MPSHESNSNSTNVELLFGAYLDGVESGADEGFDAFIARHPQHADELREMQADWARLSTHLDGALPGPLPDDESFAMTIPVGPTVQVEAGDVVAGDYRLERLVGRGGMGQVWEAEQLSLGRRVALKLLRSGRGGPDEPARLQAEARAAGRLTHDGLVTVYAAGEADGVHFIAQQLVGTGDTLADVINRRREEPGMSAEDYRRLAVFFADVAEAVHSAHEKGVLHRDLKPRNILIGGDGRPRVGDFGLAHVAEDAGTTARPGLVGTYAYMSPEQVSERDDMEIDRRSDVFSLGVVFYEALTLRRAFEGDSARQILERVRNADPPDPRTIRSHIPHDLAVICGKAMQKVRDDRYESMQAFAGDLRRFLANEPIEARPPGAVGRVEKWVRRHPAKAMAVLLGSLGVLAISALLVRETELRQQSDENAEAAIESEAQAKRSAALADQRAAEALRQGYLANILAASMHLDRGRRAEARRLLMASDVGSRGWEWEHLWLRADASLLVLHGHDDEVSAVATSFDGARVATASLDGTVNLWDGTDGRLLARLSGHEGAVLAVALSDDGAVVVTGGADGTVRAWDGAGGVERGVLVDHGDPVHAVSVSRDGRRVASGGADQTARVVDVSAGLDIVVRPQVRLPVVSVALSRDGSTLVTGTGYGAVEVWDAETGVPFGALTGVMSDAVTVALSGDGHRIVSGEVDGKVRVWDRDSGNKLLVLQGHDFRVSSVSISDDGTRIVSASEEDGRLSMWDAESGGLRAQITVHDGQVNAVALAADGSRIVVGGDGARVWDGARVFGGSVAAAAVVLEGGGRAPNALAASRDGEVIAIAYSPEGRIDVWNGRNGERRAEIFTQPYGLGPVSVSDGGERIVSGGYDGMVRVWDGRDGALLGALEGHDQRVTSVATVGNGVIAASGSLDGTVRVWDTVSGQVLSVFSWHEKAVTSVAASEDGSTLVSAGRDGRVGVHHVESGRTLELDPGEWNDDGIVAVSADGSRVAWGSLRSPTLRLWDGGTGEERVTFDVAGSGLVALAMSPDGERIMGALAGGRDLHVWNGTTGDTLAVLTGHLDPVSQVVMTRDGRRLISAGGSGAVIVWETERTTLRELIQGLESQSSR